MRRVGLYLRVIVLGVGTKYKRIHRTRPAVISAESTQLEAKNWRVCDRYRRLQKFYGELA